MSMRFVVVYVCAYIHHMHRVDLNGASNCTAACLLGWCKSNCAEPVQRDLNKCTGFTSGSATPPMQSTAGACSADDESKLADGGPLGQSSGMAVFICSALCQ